MSQPKKFIIPIPYELLYQLYVTKRMPTQSIAKQLHCSQSTIVKGYAITRFPFTIEHLTSQKRNSFVYTKMARPSNL